MREGLTYIQVNKKNRKNTLVTGILIGLDIFLMMAIIGTFLADNSFSVYLTNFIIFAVVTYFTYERLNGQSVKASLVVVKDFDRREVLASLENEIFYEEFTLGKNKVYKSENWINICSFFIPKKFFKYTYISRGLYEVYTVNMLLLTGRIINFTVGAVNKDLENTLNALKKIIPQFKLTEADVSHHLGVQTEYINRYRNEKNNGLKLNLQ